MRVTWYGKKRYKCAHYMDCSKRRIANEAPERNETIFKRRLSTIHCYPDYGFYTHLYAPEELVHETTLVGLSQRLWGLNNSVEVRIKQLHHDV